jgi:hypothetical protein
MCTNVPPRVMLCAPRSHVRVSSTVMVGFSRPWLFRLGVGFVSVVPRFPFEPLRLNENGPVFPIDALL